MTRFKKFMNFVYLAFLVAALAAVSLVILGVAILINVSGFTVGTPEGVWIVIAIDVVTFVAISIFIDTLLTERYRKKNGLSCEEVADFKFIFR